jgi:hydrogenase maturation protease
MKDQDRPILVLGIGNILMRDEGVGVHVARYVARAADDGEIALPPNTRVVDGGTLGLDLLPMVTDARSIVFIDAVDSGTIPGHVAVWQGGDLERGFGNHLSSHEIGAADLLALGRLTGELPTRVALVGVQPGAIEVGLQMTPGVEMAVPIAASLVVRQVRVFGEREATGDA